jgi:hypothetical protein
MIYSWPNQPGLSVSDADTQTAVSYATLAVVPIQLYASQYGASAVTVSTTVIPFNVDLAGNSFTDAELQGWVNTFVTRNSLLSNTCVVVLNPRGVVNTDADPSKGFLGYHFVADVPYIFVNVSGEDFTVADPHNLYAGSLSHEIAEMVVDPQADIKNPEVCDACAGNCDNDLFDLFDQNGIYMGGTADTASASGFQFYIDCIVRPDGYDASTQCVVDGVDSKRACIYPPPMPWSGQGPLTSVGSPVSITGHFSSGDQRNLVVVATAHGAIHEVFWHPAQSGIEGEDDLPVAFNPGTVASVGSIYNVDQQRHIVLVGTTAGKVHEIYWKPETVGTEGDDDLPVAFPANSIVALSGLYDTDTQRHTVFVGTTAGTVREIYWKADTVGIEGQDDLPVSFPPGSIVGVTGFYDSDQQRYLVIVATKQGKLHEIFWKSTTVGVEGHDDVPVDFGAGSIAAVSGFYDSYRRRYVVTVGTTDGTLHEVYWQADTVGIERWSSLSKFEQGSIVGVAGFYSASDNLEHTVAALATGQLIEFWKTPDL